ncbi:MAG: leucine--tRNA ligase, partial [Deltaproteobacteria bacterium]
LGPLDRSLPWSTDGIMGVYRFLQKAWRLLMAEGQEVRLKDLPDTEGTLEQRRLMARTIAQVTEDLEALAFNTAISQLMVFVRDIEKTGPLPRKMARDFTLLLAPFAPHIAEEFWQHLGETESLAYAPWPTPEAEMLVEETIEIVVQVNGKLRDRITLPAEAEREEIEARALASERVQKHLGGKPPRKIIVVPKRLVNIVV